MVVVVRDLVLVRVQDRVLESVVLPSLVEVEEDVGGGPVGSPIVLEGVVLVMMHWVWDEQVDG